MKEEFIVGTLVGVRDGPVIVVDVRGEEKKFPLGCELTVDWVYSHMGSRVMCLLKSGKVVQVE